MTCVICYDGDLTLWVAENVNCHGKNEYSVYFPFKYS